MGPMATQILGDLGADVITIESATGDTNRAMGPGPHPYLSGISLNLLRNKRNVAINLKDPRGRDILLRLAATCDVFVTNLRPGPLARLGATYDDVAAVRPDIVYCQAQGFPSDSERANDRRTTTSSSRQVASPTRLSARTAFLRWCRASSR